MPHRPSRRPRNRRSQAPMSADCRPAPARPAASPPPASASASSCMPGLCPTTISRCGSAARCRRGWPAAFAPGRRHKVPAACSTCGGGTSVLHRRPGNFPGLLRPDRGRNQHGIGKRRMPRDPAADLGGVMRGRGRRDGGPVAAAGRVVLGLGVTQQHQTAHGAISIRSSPDRLMYKHSPCHGGRSSLHLRCRSRATCRTVEPHSVDQSAAGCHSRISKFAEDKHGECRAKFGLGAVTR